MASEFGDHLAATKMDAPRLEFRFWPSYQTPSGFAQGATVPDLVLTSTRTLLFVEAKLFATFGDQQVERELAIALAEARGRQAFLLLVTPSGRCPRFSVNGRRLPFVDYVTESMRDGSLSGEVADRLRRSAPRVLSISWNGVLTSLLGARDKHRRQRGEGSEEVRRAAAMLEDLRQLMEMRGICAFEGIAASPCMSAVSAQHRPIVFTLADETATRIGLRRLCLSRALSCRPQALPWQCPRTTRHDHFIGGSCLGRLSAFQYIGFSVAARKAARHPLIGPCCMNRHCESLHVGRMVLHGRTDRTTYLGLASIATRSRLLELPRPLLLKESPHG